MTVINVNDFCYMCQGKALPHLTVETNQLNPISHIGNKRENALLLLHGFSSSPAVYRLLIPELSCYDTIICPALPGHAENLNRFQQTHAHQWITFCENQCEQLLAEYKHVDVMGLSLGGLLAYHLGQRYPLHHLYLLAPALHLRLNTSLTLFLARTLSKLGLQRLQNRAGNLYSTLHPELTYCQLPLKAIIEVVQFIKQFNYKPPRCPTDVFLGRFDQVVDVEKVADLFLETPNVRVHWLNESAHILPLDTNYKAIITCCTDHILEQKESADLACLTPHHQTP